MDKKDTLKIWAERIGRWLFALAFLGFGINQFIKTGKYVDAMPAYYPFPTLWIYLTGLGYIAAALSFFTNFKAQLGALIVIFFLVIYLAVLFLPEAAHNKTYVATYLVYIAGALMIYGNAKNN